MKRLVMILFVFWGLAMEGAWVEAQTPTGDSFVKGEMKSGDEYVELLRLRSSRVVPTPSQVLAAFQARDPEARLKNLSDLYAYISELDTVPCPAGTNLIMARYVFSTRLLHTDFERVCKPGEMLLRNRRTKEIIASLDCGNTVGSPRYLPGDEPVLGVEVKTVMVPSKPDTVRLPAPPARVEMQFKTDTLWRSRPWGWRVAEDGIFGVIGGIVGYNLRQFPACPAIPGGGPVNPPNQTSPVFGVSLRINR